MMSMIGLGVIWYSVYNVVHKHISYITKKMHWLKLVSIDIFLFFSLVLPSTYL